MLTSVFIPNQNNSYYFGEWQNDKYHGKGVYQYSKSSKKLDYGKMENL